MNPKKVVRRVVPKSGVRAIETGYRRGRGVLWQTRYGFPTRSLKIIAVTGTNGKTTTLSYINSALQAAGLRTAVYTTAYFEIAGQRTPNRTHMTVAGQKSVQQFFARAKAANVDYVLLEITSNALDQKRIAGVKVEVAVMTNLTQDHLDYHGTMEAYAAAKARLFSNEYQPKHVILNADDEWFAYFSTRAVGAQLTYGTAEQASIRLVDHKSTPAGSSFAVKYGEQKLAGTTQLVGLFNIYNALAALGVGTALGLDQASLLRGIAQLTNVPGRMEAIEAGQSFKVLVDFAYTPDALENALVSLREITPGKVRIVFGATGDRDKGKRPMMGKAVADHADAIYLTDDETYTENPEAIRQAVYEGIEAAGGAGKTQIFDDRLEAIRQAFRDAKKGDTVLLAGIGHEDYRNMGGSKLSWDERDIARQELRSLL